MMQTIFSLMLLCFIGSVAGLIGGIVLILSKKLAQSLAKYGIPLAAGVLLSTSFLDLLPHAYEEIGQRAFSWVLGTYVVLFIVEQFIIHLHHHDEGNGRKHSHNSIPLVIVGDTVHNFLDGVAIATAFLANPSLGLVVAFGTFLHETPHEIADFGILLSSGWSKSRAFWTNFFSSMATFPGAFIAFYAHQNFEIVSGILLSVAVGLFLYVATTDFLPRLGKFGNEFSMTKFIVFLIGILLIVIFTQFVPEIEHEEGGEIHDSYRILNNDMSLL